MMDRLRNTFEREPELKKETKLFGHGVKIDRLENDETIPVGGHMLESKHTKRLLCDFDKCTQLFEEIHARLLRIKSPEIQAILRGMIEERDLGISLESFTPIVALAKIFESRHFSEGGKHLDRKEKYGEGEARLSELVDESLVECAEIAAIAQYELQRNGVESFYLGGYLLTNHDQEFGSAHSFIVLSDGSETYVYDPARPIKIPEGLFPNINRVDGDFDQILKTKKKAYAQTTNILTGKKTYYGVDNGTHVNPERDIVS